MGTEEDEVKKGGMTRKEDKSEWMEEEMTGSDEMTRKNNFKICDKTGLSILIMNCDRDAHARMHDWVNVCVNVCMNEIRMRMRITREYISMINMYKL